MKTISFKAEKYYRIAYDSFFYTEDNDKAHKCANIALECNPNHIKTLRLKASILIFEDKISRALEVLFRLNELLGDDFEVFSKIAYCYEQTADYALAFEFCEKSAMCVDLGDWERMGTLYKLKIDLLLEVNHKIGAQKLLRNALKMLNNEEGQSLKQNYAYLGVSANSSVVNLFEAKKAL